MHHYIIYHPNLPAPFKALQVAALRNDLHTFACIIMLTSVCYHPSKRRRRLLWRSLRSSSHLQRPGRPETSACIHTLFLI